MVKGAPKPTPAKPAPVRELISFHPDTLSLIPDEYFAAIGRISAVWALLDSVLDLAIWQAAQTPQMLGACVTAQIFSTPARIKVLGALLRVHKMTAKHTTFLDKFEQETHGLAIKRNRAVHDTIAVGRDTGQVYRMTATVDNKKELVFGMLPSGPKSLQQAFRDINVHVTKFGDFWSETSAELYTLRTTTPLSLEEIVQLVPQATHKPSSAKRRPRPRSSPG